MKFLGISNLVTTTIRHAVLEDALGLQNLMSKSFPLACPPSVSAADIQVYLARKCSVENFKSNIADDKTVLIVACNGSELLGYSLLVFDETESSDIASQLSSVTSNVKLSRFYVHPDWHGEGVAQKLMQRTFEIVHELGWSALWLTVNQQNERANRFYQKWGFEIVGEADFILGGSVQRDFVRERFFTD